MISCKRRAFIGALISAPLFLSVPLWIRNSFSQSNSTLPFFETVSDFLNSTLSAPTQEIQIHRFNESSPPLTAKYKRIKRNTALGTGTIQHKDGSLWLLNEDNVDPIMFGALSDGTSPDCQAINDALAFAQEHKDTNVILNGHYLTDKNIVVPPHVSVVGKGVVNVVKGKWILQTGVFLSGPSFIGKEKGFKPVVKIDYAARDVRIQECVVSGGTGIWLNVNKNCSVINNQISSFGGYPIFCDGLSDGRIERNKCSCVEGYGVQLSGDFERNIIKDNQITGDGKTRTGVIIISQRLGKISDNKITGNKIFNVSEEGISVDYNTKTYFGHLTEDMNEGEFFIKALFEKTVTQNLKGHAVFILDGPYAGHSAVVKKHTPGSNFIEIENNNFPSLSSGTSIAVAWAPLNTLIENNEIKNAGKTGIMLYGSQINSVVKDNYISSCGFARNPSWQGMTPYVCAGMSALTISLKAHSQYNDCLVHAPRFEGNKVEDCPVGFSVGIALWSGKGKHQPVGVSLKNNNFIRCSQSIKYEHGMNAKDISHQ